MDGDDCDYLRGLIDEARSEISTLAETVGMLLRGKRVVLKADERWDDKWSPKRKMLKYPEEWATVVDCGGHGITVMGELSGIRQDFLHNIRCVE